MMRCSAPRSSLTPSMRTICVPAPLIFAPMRVQHLRQARDLGLARGVDDRRRAFGERRGEHDVERAHHARVVEHDAPAAQRAVLAHVEDVAVLRRPRAEHAEAGEVHVERADADRVAAGRRARRASEAREQRPHDEEARAQLRREARRHLPARDVGALMRSDAGAGCSTVAPRYARISSICRTSPMSGTLCRTTSSAVSSAAAIA